MLQNAYLLAKIGADTGENERNFAKNWQLPYALKRLSEVEGESNEWKKRPSLHTLTLEVIKRETENEAQQDLWATLANRQKNAEPPCCSANPRDWCTPILASFGY